jgi:hypothetical protein
MVLFGWLSANPFFKELTDVNTREGLYNQQMKSIQQNLTPFVMRKSNDEPEGEVIGGDYWLLDEEYAKKVKELGLKF